MQTSVIVFPGSNCDRDALTAASHFSGRPAHAVWHRESALPAGTDLVIVPGGFSYGDYLRCGAMAARSPVMAAVSAFAAKGGLVLGICNGFQVLTEAGLLPGALVRNAGLHFVCRNQPLVVETTASPFTTGLRVGGTVHFPIAHAEGNYRADEDTLDRLEGEGRVAFRYAPGTNPNGAARDIAGVLSGNGRVLGLMPHPERAVGIAPGGQEGGTDGEALFRGLFGALAAA
jgi:phosphoribosylformylglycinamidine synthase